MLVDDRRHGLADGSRERFLDNEVHAVVSGHHQVTVDESRHGAEDLACGESGRLTHLIDRAVTEYERGEHTPSGRVGEQAREDDGVSSQGTDRPGR